MHDNFVPVGKVTADLGWRGLLVLQAKLAWESPTPCLSLLARQAFQRLVSLLACLIVQSVGNRRFIDEVRELLLCCLWCLCSFADFLFLSIVVIVIVVDILAISRLLLDAAVVLGLQSKAHLRWCTKGERRNCGTKPTLSVVVILAGISALAKEDADKVYLDLLAFEVCKGKQLIISSLRKCSS